MCVTPWSQVTSRRSHRFGSFLVVSRFSSSVVTYICTLVTIVETLFNNKTSSPQIFYFLSPDTEYHTVASENLQKRTDKLRGGPARGDTSETLSQPRKTTKTNDAKDPIRKQRESSRKIDEQRPNQPQQQPITIDRPPTTSSKSKVTTN